MYLFQNSAIQQNFQAKGISEAGQVLDVLQLDETERRHYDHYINSLRDEKSLIETHYTSGHQDGLKQGKYDIATAMKNKGMAIVDIADMTGLSIETVLRNKKIAGFSMLPNGSDVRFLGQCGVAELHKLDENRADESFRNRAIETISRL
jgi:hypothetical protein